MRCCYRHIAFPSNVTGSHVCSKLSLKRLRTKLCGAYRKISLKPFRQFGLYYPLFSSLLPASHSTTMNLRHTSSEGSGKYLLVCQQQ